MRMTDEELSAIEARASRAAPGPWEDAEGSVWENGQRRVDEAFVRRPGDSVAVASSILNPCADPRDVPSQDTAIFIAHAREDVPALVTEVRRLSADLTAMTASRDEWRTIAQESIAHHEETARERDELREIIDGSEVAPTDAEIIRHAELNGRWRAQTIGGLVADCMGARMTAALRDIDRESGITRKWWATTEDGTLCARPTAGGGA